MVASQQAGEEEAARAGSDRAESEEPAALEPGAVARDEASSTGGGDGGDGEDTAGTPQKRARTGDVMALARLGEKRRPMAKTRSRAATDRLVSGRSRRRGAAGVPF